MVENKLTTKYEILTPDGWVDFEGVRKSPKSSYTFLEFEKTTIKCSEDHLVLTEDGFKKACSLDLNSRIITDDGICKIKNKKTINESIDLYDALEVETSRYYTNGIVSHNCDFIGSTNTLISSSKLHVMNFEEPLSKSPDGIDVYEEPKSGHNYIITVDTARGQGKDYSALLVIDITEPPYKVVLKYRNNLISPMVYPTVIRTIAEKYNEAYVLIETNDIGSQVADVLYEDLEYDNMASTVYKGRSGQVISSGFGGAQMHRGVRTTIPVKKLGCSVVKSLVENDKLLIHDIDVINELYTFVAKGQSFEADEGHNDDLVMCLVLFGWLTRQDYFKNLTERDVRLDVYEDEIERIEDEVLPFGFMAHHEDDEDDGWQKVNTTFS